MRDTIQSARLSKVLFQAAFAAVLTCFLYRESSRFLRQDVVAAIEVLAIPSRSLLQTQPGLAAPAIIATPIASTPPPMAGVQSTSLSPVVTTSMLKTSSISTMTSGRNKSGARNTSTLTHDDLLKLWSDACEPILDHEEDSSDQVSYPRGKVCWQACTNTIADSVLSHTVFGFQAWLQSFEVVQVLCRQWGIFPTFFSVPIIWVFLPWVFIFMSSFFFSVLEFHFGWQQEPLNRKQLVAIQQGVRDAYKKNKKRIPFELLYDPAAEKADKKQLLPNAHDIRSGGVLDDVSFESHSKEEQVAIQSSAVAQENDGDQNKSKTRYGIRSEISDFKAVLDALDDKFLQDMMPRKETCPKGYSIYDPASTLNKEEDDGLYIILQPVEGSRTKMQYEVGKEVQIEQVSRDEADIKGKVAGTKDWIPLVRRVHGKNWDPRTAFYAEPVALAACARQFPCDEGHKMKLVVVSPGDEAKCLICNKKLDEICIFAAQSSINTSDKNAICQQCLVKKGCEPYSQCYNTECGTCTLRFGDVGQETNKKCDNCNGDLQDSLFWGICPKEDCGKTYCSKCSFKSALKKPLESEEDVEHNRLTTDDEKAVIGCWFVGPVRLVITLKEGESEKELLKCIVYHDDGNKSPDIIMEWDRDSGFWEADRDGTPWQFKIVEEKGKEKDMDYMLLRIGGATGRDNYLTRQASRKHLEQVVKGIEDMESRPYFLYVGNKDRLARLDWFRNLLLAVAGSIYFLAHSWFCVVLIATSLVVYFVSDEDVIIERHPWAEPWLTVPLEIRRFLDIQPLHEFGHVEDLFTLHPVFSVFLVILLLICARCVADFFNNYLEPLEKLPGKHQYWFALSKVLRMWVHGIYAMVGLAVVSLFWIIFGWFCIFVFAAYKAGSHYVVWSCAKSASAKTFGWMDASAPYYVGGVYLVISLMHGLFSPPLGAEYCNPPKKANKSKYFCVPGIPDTWLAKYNIAVHGGALFVDTNMDVSQSALFFLRGAPFFALATISGVVIQMMIFAAESIRSGGERSVSILTCVLQSDSIMYVRGSWRKGMILTDMLRKSAREALGETYICMLVALWALFASKLQYPIDILTLFSSVCMSLKSIKFGVAEAMELSHAEDEVPISTQNEKAIGIALIPPDDYDARKDLKEKRGLDQVSHFRVSETIATLCTVVIVVGCSSPKIYWIASCFATVVSFAGCVWWLSRETEAVMWAVSSTTAKTYLDPKDDARNLTNFLSGVALGTKLYGVQSGDFVKLSHHRGYMRVKDLIKVPQNSNELTPNCCKSPERRGEFIVVSPDGVQAVTEKEMQRREALKREAKVCLGCSGCCNCLRWCSSKVDFTGKWTDALGKDVLEFDQEKANDLVLWLLDVTDTSSGQQEENASKPQEDEQADTEQDLQEESTRGLLSKEGKVGKEEYHLNPHSSKNGWHVFDCQNLFDIPNSDKKYIRVKSIGSNKILICKYTREDKDLPDNVFDWSINQSAQEEGWLVLTRQDAALTIRDLEEGADPPEDSQKTVFQADSDGSDESMEDVQYFVVADPDLPVTVSRERSSPEVAKLKESTKITVLSMEDDDDGYKRARIENPEGWITAWTSDKSTTYIKEALGSYIVKSSILVTEDWATDSNFIKELKPGANVTILGFSDELANGIVRARIESPDGWISAWYEDRKEIWVKKATGDRYVKKEFLTADGEHTWQAKGSDGRLYYYALKSAQGAPCEEVVLERGKTITGIDEGLWVRVVEIPQAFKFKNTDEEEITLTRTKGIINAEVVGKGDVGSWDSFDEESGKYEAGKHTGTVITEKIPALVKYLNESSKTLKELLAEQEQEYLMRRAWAVKSKNEAYCKKKIVLPFCCSFIGTDVGGKGQWIRAGDLYVPVQAWDGDVLIQKEANLAFDGTSKLQMFLQRYVWTWWLEIVGLQDLLGTWIAPKMETTEGGDDSNKGEGDVECRGTSLGDEPIEQVGGLSYRCKDGRILVKTTLANAKDRTVYLVDRARKNSWQLKAWDHALGWRALGCLIILIGSVCCLISSAVVIPASQIMLWSGSVIREAPNDRKQGLTSLICSFEFATLQKVVWLVIMWSFLILSYYFSNSVAISEYIDISEYVDSHNFVSHIIAGCHAADKTKKIASLIRAMLSIAALACSFHFAYSARELHRLREKWKSTDATSAKHCEQAFRAAKDSIDDALERVMECTCAGQALLTDEASRKLIALREKIGQKKTKEEANILQLFAEDLIDKYYGKEDRIIFESITLGRGDADKIVQEMLRPPGYEKRQKNGEKEPETHPDLFKVRLPPGYEWVPAKYDDEKKEMIPAQWKYDGDKNSELSQKGLKIVGKLLDWTLCYGGDLEVEGHVIHDEISKDNEKQVETVKKKLQDIFKGGERVDRKGGLKTSDATKSTGSGTKQNNEKEKGKEQEQGKDKDKDEQTEKQKEAETEENKAGGDNNKDNNTGEKAKEQAKNPKDPSSTTKDSLGLQQLDEEQYTFVFGQVRTKQKRQENAEDRVRKLLTSPQSEIFSVSELRTHCRQAVEIMETGANPRLPSEALNQVSDALAEVEDALQHLVLHESGKDKIVSTPDDRKARSATEESVDAAKNDIEQESTNEGRSSSGFCCCQCWLGDSSKQGYTALAMVEESTTGSGLPPKNRDRDNRGIYTVKAEESDAVGDKNRIGIQMINATIDRLNETVYEDNLRKKALGSVFDLPIIWEAAYATSNQTALDNAALDAFFQPIQTTAKIGVDTREKTKALKYLAKANRTDKILEAMRESIETFVPKEAEKEGISKKTEAAEENLKQLLLAIQNLENDQQKALTSRLNEHDVKLLTKVHENTEDAEIQNMCVYFLLESKVKDAAVHIAQVVWQLLEDLERDHVNDRAFKDDMLEAMPNWMCIVRPIADDTFKVQVDLPATIYFSSACLNKEVRIQTLSEPILVEQKTMPIQKSWITKDGLLEINLPSKEEQQLEIYSALVARESFDSEKVFDILKNFHVVKGPQTKKNLARNKKEEKRLLSRIMELLAGASTRDSERYEDVDVGDKDPKRKLREILANPMFVTGNQEYWYWERDVVLSSSSWDMGSLAKQFAEVFQYSRDAEGRSSSTKSFAEIGNVLWKCGPHGINTLIEDALPLCTTRADKSYGQNVRKLASLINEANDFTYQELGKSQLGGKAVIVQSAHPYGWRHAITTRVSFPKAASLSVFFAHKSRTLDSDSKVGLNSLGAGAWSRDSFKSTNIDKKPFDLLFATDGYGSRPGDGYRCTTDDDTAKWGFLSLVVDEEAIKGSVDTHQVSDISSFLLPGKDETADGCWMQDGAVVATISGNVGELRFMRSLDGKGIQISKESDKKFSVRIGESDYKAELGDDKKLHWDFGIIWERPDVNAKDWCSLKYEAAASTNTLICSGKFSHPEIRGGDDNVIVVVTGTNEQGKWIDKGKWNSCKETQGIQIVCDGKTVVMKDSNTEFRGEMESDGVLKGTVTQGGKPGGTFHLKVYEAATGYIDKDRDAVFFNVEDEKLIKYVNGSKKVGPDGDSGVVEKLQYKLAKPADVRDQHNYGSNDFPLKVVRELKALADRVNVPHNFPELDTQATGYLDKDGDEVRYVIEGGKLIYYTNGNRGWKAGDGKNDDSGVVKGLKYKKGNPCDVRDQYNWGSNDFPWDVARDLKILADRVGVPIEMPEAGTDRTFLAQALANQIAIAVDDKYAKQISQLREKIEEDSDWASEAFMNSLSDISRVASRLEQGDKLLEEYIRLGAKHPLPRVRFSVLDFLRGGDTFRKDKINIVKTFVSTLIDQFKGLSEREKSEIEMETSWSIINTIYMTVREFGLSDSKCLHGLLELITLIDSQFEKSELFPEELHGTFLEMERGISFNHVFLAKVSDALLNEPDLVVEVGVGEKFFTTCGEFCDSPYATSSAKKTICDTLFDESGEFKILTKYGKWPEDLSPVVKTMLEEDETLVTFANACVAYCKSPNAVLKPRLVHIIRQYLPKLPPLDDQTDAKKKLIEAKEKLQSLIDSIVVPDQQKTAGDEKYGNAPTRKNSQIGKRQELEEAKNKLDAQKEVAQKEIDKWCRDNKYKDLHTPKIASRGPFSASSAKFALHTAVKHAGRPGELTDKIKVIKHLVLLGAHLDAKDSNGETAIELANKMQEGEIKSRVLKALLSQEESGEFDSQGSSDARSSVKQPARSSEMATLVFNASGSAKTVDVAYKPLGLKFGKQLPMKISGFVANSYGETLGIKEGWILTSVNGDRLDGSKDYNDAMSVLTNHIQKLPTR